MGLIDDANNAIALEKQRKHQEKQIEELVLRFRTQPVNPFHYTLPVTSEVKYMLGDFVRVMRQYNVTPSPCVIANGKKTMNSSILCGRSVSETVAFSLAGFNAWSITKPYRHGVKAIYAVTERAELVRIMPLSSKEKCAYYFLQNYFPDYVASEKDRSESAKVKRSINTKALKGTPITVEKVLVSPSGFPKKYDFRVYIGNRRAMILCSFNIMNGIEQTKMLDTISRKRWDTTPIGAGSYLGQYEINYTYDTTEDINQPLKEQLIELIVEANKGDFSGFEWTKIPL
jgi:hypothetical protein